MSGKRTSSSNPVGKWVFLIFVGLALLTAAVSYLRKADRDAEGTAAPATPRNGPPWAQSGSESAARQVARDNSGPSAAFGKLVGRWLREDGGYVIDISDVLPDGTLKAAYFNPRPIHVSRAAAVEEAGSVKVGIELNDANYPGCLYTLVFDRALDQLQGTYFQAAMGQTFDVVFVRVPVE